MMDAKQFLYIMTDGIYVKVGRSSDVLQRIRAIQSGNPREIKPVVAFGPMDRRESAAFETEMHRAMKKTRVSGEWFDCSLESALAAAFLRAAFFCGVCFRATIFANEFAEIVQAAADLEHASGSRKSDEHDEAVAEVDRRLSCFKTQEVLA